MIKLYEHLHLLRVETEEMLRRLPNYKADINPR